MSLLLPPFVLEAADVSSGEVDEDCGTAACDRVTAGTEEVGMNVVGDESDVVVFEKLNAEDDDCVVLGDVFEEGKVVLSCVRDELDVLGVRVAWLLVLEVIVLCDVDEDELRVGVTLEEEVDETAKLVGVTENTHDTSWPSMVAEIQLV